MEPFLKKVAKALFNKFDYQIADTFVVLPSRRACMYFRYYLAQVAGKNILAPEILSMDDFISRVCNYQIIDRVSLLFELYKTYKKFDKTEEHNLEKFIPLGGAMLNDFGMIDKNLPPEKAEELFEYLEEVKALERWGKELGAPIEVKEDSTLKEYFAFWSYLRDTYKQFRQDLLARKACYSGLAYRLVHKELDQLFEKEQIHHITFAGFNQLTVIEEDILKSLKATGKATLYWDVDKFYLEKKQHEAGLYLRKFMKTWPLAIEDFVHNSINTKAIDIELIQVNNKVTQAKLIGDLLTKKIKAIVSKGEQKQFLQSMNNTAILLPDESLLSPILHALPLSENVGLDLNKCINITMGMSMQQNPMNDLIEAVFRMQQNIRPDTSNKDNFFIYHKDLLKILQHPFVRFFGEQTAAHQAIQNSVQSENIIMVSYQWLMQKSEQYEGYQILFDFWDNDSKKAFAYFYKFIEYFSNLFNSDDTALENQFLFQLYTTLKRLDDTLTQQNESISVRTFRQFVIDMIKNVKVPFTGEPITPIQIMGMLESRTLDFEHVIVLSCNEGLLPQSKSTDSIIPFDLRLKNNMPTHRENDASFAYTFYRLFHQAKKVTLIYTDKKEATGGGEKSRFLNQIEEEFGYKKIIKNTEGEAVEDTKHTKAGTNGSIKLSQLSLQLPNAQVTSKKVHKDEAVLEMVRSQLKKGVSPSAINTYITSPLQFFYRSVLKLSEADEIEETLNYRTFGTLIHETLDIMLQNKIGQVVDAELLQGILSKKEKLNTLMDEVIQEKLKKIDTSQGKNYLLRNVAESLLQKFLQLQIEKDTPFLLLSQETYQAHVLQVAIPWAAPVTFRISGKADRIDITRDKKIRIVDYKTGSFEVSKLKVGNYQQLFYEPDKEKIVQLMLYKYLLIKTIQSGKLKHLPSDFSFDTYQVTSGFFFFRKLNSHFVEYKIEDAPEDINEFCNMVEAFIKDLVTDMLDPSQAFTEEASPFPHIIKK